MRPADIETVGRIWLAASIEAHHFVPAEFWRRDLATMTGEILPHPNTDGHVHEEDDVVDGFVTLGGSFIGCLFVRPDRQRRGIGSALLDHVKGRHERLALRVYRENEDAVRFYLAHGFGVVGETTCPHTGHAELEMSWTRPCDLGPER